MPPPATFPFPVSVIAGMIGIDEADLPVFLSGGVFTAQTRERLDQIGAPRLEKPVSGQGLRAWGTRVADG